MQSIIPIAMHFDIEETRILKRGLLSIVILLKIRALPNDVIVIIFLLIVTLPK